MIIFLIIDKNGCNYAIASPDEIARDDNKIFYTEEIEVDSMKYLIISVVPLGQSRVSSTIVNLTKDSLECAYYELQLTAP